MDKKLAEAIKNVCFNAYNKKLSKNGKCKDGVEWTVFSAIVMKKQKNNNSKDSPVLRVVSMGTGTKCIGQELIDEDGCMVHDSHAEVIARRSFLCYLYDQIEACLKGGDSALELDSCGFVVVPRGTEFFMFSTSAPCGDACIMDKNLSKINANGDENEEEDVGEEVGDDDYEPDAKKFRSSNAAFLKTGAKTLSADADKDESPAKQLAGKLRTKPGRGSRSLSLSCTDKLCRWNVLGLQGTLLMHFMAKPLCLSGVIVCSPLYDEQAMRRGVYGRLEDQNNNNKINNNNNISKEIKNKNNDNNSNNFNNFNNNNTIKINKPLLYHINTNDFVNSKWLPCHKNLDPSPAGICWYDNDKGLPQQVVVRGRLLGATKKSTSMPFVCQASLFRRFLSVKNLFQQKGFKFRHAIEECVTYRDFKQASHHYQTSLKLFKSNHFKNWPSKHKHYDFK